jgi:anti-anti-sigma factor
VAQFEIRESTEADGETRLTLTGELDMGSAVTLEERLDQINGSGERVLLDLSQLEFLDSSGLRVLLMRVTGSRLDGGRIRIDRDLSPVVRQVVSLTGVERQLWPSDLV